MYWYEEEIKRIEQEHAELTYEADTVFYGSSSIRLWHTLYEDFSDIKPVNLGFGGSTLAACVWYFNRIMKPYHPKQLIIYAGDNDLGDGRHPEEVFIFFQQLLVRVHDRFGNLPCYYVSLKPSLSRWHLVDQFRHTNSMIKNEISRHHSNWQFINIFDRMLSPTNHPDKKYYEEDGLHLSEEGYVLWKEIITDSISTKA